MLYFCSFMVISIIIGNSNLVKIDVSKTTVKNATTLDAVTTSTVSTSSIVETTSATSRATESTETVLVSATTSPDTIDVLNTTFTNTTKTNQWPLILRKVTRRRSDSDGYFCKCDLTINLCDINCCCDIDCPRDLLSSFVCDESDQSIHDYYWDIGLHSCSIKDDLFCVFRQNENRNQKRFDPLLRKPDQAKWPNPLKQAPNTEDDHEHYRPNDPILSYQELAEEVYPLTIPTAIVGNNCHLNVPIKFLKASQIRTCLRSQNAHELYVRRLQIQLMTTKILTSRRGTGNHNMMSEFCGLTTDDSIGSNVCQSMRIFECVNSVSPTNCHPFNETEYEIDATFQNNMILYEFVHNFTHVLNGTVYFVFNPDNGQQQRTTEVRFRQLNDSVIPHYSISGNIGYYKGKPIIISYWTPSNSSEENSPLIINYFHANNSEHDVLETQLRIPTFHQNQCRLDRDVYKSILFGHDTYVKCNVVLNQIKSEFQAAANLTKLCRRFQSTVFRYILNGVRQQDNQTNYSDIKTIVSGMGNPKNESTDWQHIMSNIDADAAMVEGHPVNDGPENSFQCRNMVLGVSYEFEYARLTVSGHPHQNVIKAVKLRLGTKLDLKFSMDEVWRIPVFVDGVFVDLTGSAIRMTPRSVIVLIFTLVVFVL